MGDADSFVRVLNGYSKGRTTGRLRRPSRLTAKNDFSTSFTQKVKLNNETLAKSLAKANSTIEMQAEELKDQKAMYSELLMQKNSDDVYYAGTFAKLDMYVSKSLQEMKGIVETLVMIKQEMLVTRARQSSGKFDDTLSQRGPSCSTQTQCVKPMVKGHSIGQPRISLSRLSPRCENGARVPAVPLPAVPTGADGPEQQFHANVASVAITDQVSHQLQANAVSATITEDVSGSADSNEPKTFGARSPQETMAMFRNRLRNEDPQEGCSKHKKPRRGKPRPLRILRPQMAYVELSDDDCDDGNSGNRTSYSPSMMDETQTVSGMSAAIQERSPATASAVASSSSSQPGQTSAGNGLPATLQSFPPKSTTVGEEGFSSKAPETVRGNPEEPVFRGFCKTGHEDSDRSRKALEAAHWRESPVEGREPHVSKHRSTPKKPLKTQSPKDTPMETSCTEPKLEKRKSVKRSKAVSPARQIDSVTTTKDLKHPSTVEKPLGTRANPCAKTSNSEPPRKKEKVGTHSEALSQQGQVNSVPNRMTKQRGIKPDPDWVPSKSAGNSAPKVQAGLRRRQPGASAKCEEQPQLLFDESARTPMLNSLHHPRVLINKLDAATIDAAVTRPQARSSDVSLSDVAVVVTTGRTARRNTTPVSYKEPKCNTKLRRV